MKIEELRPQFIVYILADVLDNGSKLKINLEALKYDVMLFTD